MPTRAAINCVNRQFSGCEKSFHRFPSEKSAKVLWVLKMKRANFKPSKTSVLCSDHFTPECFDLTGQTVRLKAGSIPTIFDFPPHLMKKVKERKRSVLDRSSTSCNDADDINEKTPLKNNVEVLNQAYEEETSIKVDHSYSITQSPKCIKRQLENAIDEIENMKKKVKSSRETSRRLKKKITSLQNIVDSLQQQKYLSNQAVVMLQNTFSGVPLELMKRLLKNKSTKICREKYPNVLKSFALTLQYYSPKAYKYVRRTFDLALPHPSVIRKWYSSVDGDPGFTNEAFTALRLKAEETGTNTLCSLMIDEMAIKKHIQWDGKKMSGFVDIGTDTQDPDDSTPVASEALVFMVVSLNSNWKIPVGYFLINGMSGEERANLVKQCLVKLHENKVIISSLTCDGPSCHFSMMQHLGASLDPNDLKPFFLHPTDSSHVSIFLDVCHMIKLLRNTLASGGILKDMDGHQIKWSYIEELHKLQDQEGLRLGNKLKSAHIEWRKQKMKVNLATQTLSSSVADAIEFCCKKLCLKEFENSEATVKFIRLFDRLFDILNSRNPLARNFKSPLRSANQDFWMPFLNEAFQYISKITDNAGNLMYTSRRKTPFIGFLCAIKSVIQLYEVFVKPSNGHLKYLLTYKLSQDHLELFFGAVRSSGGGGGFNNNPTASQFKAAYKRLLFRHQIKSSGGNCIQQDSTQVLSTDEVRINGVIMDTYNVNIIRRYNLDVPETILIDHDYLNAPSFSPLSEFKECAIKYIAGYVVRMVEKRIHCLICISSLRNAVKENNPLVHFKDRGGLINPSQDVIDICLASEKIFQRILSINDGKPPQGAAIDHTIANIVSKQMINSRKGTFDSPKEHMFDTSPTSNHLSSLMKCIIQCFCQIRLSHIAKEFTSKITGDKVRKTLSKLVLFKHQ